ncbi:MAG: cyclic-di-AMP receptor [Anaerolineae bacterium]
MKLVISIVNSDDARGLLDQLVNRGFRATVISTTGGFLREGNTTIFIGTDNEKVDEVLRIIRQSSHTRTQYISPLPPIMEPGELYTPHHIELQLGAPPVRARAPARFERY